MVSFCIWITFVFTDFTGKLVSGSVFDFLRIMGGMTDSSSPPNPFQRAAKNSLFLGSNTRAEARGSFGVGE